MYIYLTNISINILNSALLNNYYRKSDWSEHSLIFPPQATWSYMCGLTQGNDLSDVNFVITPVRKAARWQLIWRLTTENRVVSTSVHCVRSQHSSSINTTSIWSTICNKAPCSHLLWSFCLKTWRRHSNWSHRQLQQPPPLLISLPKQPSRRRDVLVDIPNSALLPSIKWYLLSG